MAKKPAPPAPPERLAPATDDEPSMADVAETTVAPLEDFPSADEFHRHRPPERLAPATDDEPSMAAPDHHTRCRVTGAGWVRSEGKTLAGDRRDMWFAGEVGYFPDTDVLSLPDHLIPVD